MEAHFKTIFENVRHERTLFLLLSLVEPDILKQSIFTDHETDFIKNIALEKLHRQRKLKEIVALGLLEKQFSDYWMIYPNLNNEPELLKKTREDEIKNLKYQKEKHDHESILKLLKLIMIIIRREIKV